MGKLENLLGHGPDDHARHGAAAVGTQADQLAGQLPADPDYHLGRMANMDVALGHKPRSFQECHGGRQNRLAFLPIVAIEGFRAYVVQSKTHRHRWMNMEQVDRRWFAKPVRMVYQTLHGP